MCSFLIVTETEPVKSGSFLFSFFEHKLLSDGRVRNSSDMANEAIDLTKLSLLGREALEKSYCPYSKFSVGVALLCEDGNIFTGCNVENASYGLTMCAERTAIYKAVSEGYRKFKAVVIVTSSKSDEYIGPCGACRQVLAEFGTNWDVYLTQADGSFMKRTVAEMLPMAFTPESLAKS